MTTPKAKQNPAGTGGWALLGLVLVLGAGGLFLVRVAGVPRLPGATPDWVELWLTLQGADVPLEGVLAGLAGLAWALWLWLSASVLLRLLVAAAGARAQGAAWVEGLRAFSDRVTLPVVRRVVDGAVVAGVVVQLAGRVPTVGAAGLDGPGIAPEATIAYADPAVASGAAPAAPEGQAVPDHALTTYRVRPGDSLWAIAMRFYGDGEGYPKIIEANVGRVMADGRPFTRSGVLQPGWELRVPLPERALSTGVTGAAEVTTYVVQPGDSLSGIAGRLWGRPEAWVDLFALNQGTARMADGRTLTRPELIWPGLQLTVPLAPGQPGQAVSFPPATAAHARDSAAPDASLAEAPVAAAPLPEAPLDALSGATPLPPASPEIPTQVHAPSSEAPPLAEVTPPPPAEAASAADGQPAQEVPPAGASAHVTPLPPDVSPEGPAWGRAAPALAQAPDGAPPGAPPGAPENAPLETGAPAPAATRVTAPGALAPPVTLPRPSRDLLIGAGAAAAAAAGAAAAGAAGVVAWRRRARRSLAQPPPGAPLLPLRYREPAEVTFDGGFAELDVTRPLLHRLGGGDGDAVAGAAWLVRRFLDEHALQGVGILTVVYGRDATGLTLEVTLRATPTEQGRLAALAPALGARLGGAGMAEPAPSGDIQLLLSEVRSIGLVAPGAAGTIVAWPSPSLAGASHPEPGLEPNAEPHSEADAEPGPDSEAGVGPGLGGAVAQRGAQRGGPAVSAAPTLPAAVPLIPVGAVSRRRVLVASWDEMRHVLVAGSPGGGAGTVLASTVAALAARFQPDALRLWMIGTRRSLPPELLALPHQVGGPVDPEDAEGMEAVVVTVRDELVRRMRQTARLSAGARAPEHPLVVLLVPELTEGSAGWEAAGDTAERPAAGAPFGGGSGLSDLLHAVAVDGPECGIHLLAATSQAGRLDPDLASLFPTRLVLQTEDEAQSVRLIGRPDAATLDEGGDLLFTLDGRAPRRLRGFRVSHRGLVALLRLLRTSHGAGGAAVPPLSPVAFSPPSASTSAPAPAPAGEIVPFPPGGPPAPGAGPLTQQPAPPVTPASPAGVAPPEEPSNAGGTEEAERAAPDTAAAAGAAGAVSATAAAGAPDTAGAAGAAGLTAPAGAGGASASAPAGAGATGAAAGAQEDTPRPIEVRCFGGFDVLLGEQRLSATGQTGPRHRSWEVLAYLAAQPSEVVSTEKLLAAVWPDSGAERAGSAFGAALSRLRGVLLHQVPGLTGPLVLRDRVGRTCRLDGAALVSDVHTFAAFCREGRRLPPAAAAAAYEQARALYVGDLLRDQPYPWLHERDDDGLTLPERYRETYRQITNDLAGLYVQSGAPERAVALYRELLRAEPTLEDVARRLYRCYGRLGDRVSLVREHHRLQQALQEAYGRPEDGGDPALTDPEPETVTVFEEVLALLDAGPAAPPATLPSALGQHGSPGRTRIGEGTPGTPPGEPGGADTGEEAGDGPSPGQRIRERSTGQAPDRERRVGAEGDAARDADADAGASGPLMSASRPEHTRGADQRLAADLLEAERREPNRSGGLRPEGDRPQDDPLEDERLEAARPSAARLGDEREGYAA